MTASPRVHLVTLGCARNEVDSDELAGRLTADGWDLSAGPESADLVVVNTCGFIDAAKADSISAVLELADSAPVVATGCMAQRYGTELAAELPEAAAVLGFDHYPVIGQTLRKVLAGEEVPAHAPHDRRALLPVTPVLRTSDPDRVPGHASAATLGGTSQRILRRRLASGPVAALKIDRDSTLKLSKCFEGAGGVAEPTLTYDGDAILMALTARQALAPASSCGRHHRGPLHPGQALVDIAHAQHEIDDWARRETCVPNARETPARPPMPS